MPMPQNLQAKLDAYEATSRHQATAGKRRRRRWAAYAAAAGSGLAMTTAADADIIYSGVQNLSATQTNPGTAHLKIDMDGRSINGSVVRFNNISFAGGNAKLIPGAGVELLAGSNNSWLGHLASGANISSGNINFTDQLQFIRHASNHLTPAAAPNIGGDWPKSQEGFAGVKFTQSGQTHLGWIRLEWKGSLFQGYSAVPRSLKVIDWAYESTPDTAILAGAGIPPSVPEPNTAMIAWLASGCVGVLAWRKHRRQLAEKARAETAEVVPDIPRE